MNFRGVADIDRAIAQNLWRIDRHAYDVVIGIPRSGMIPASIIATYLQLPLSTPDGYMADIVHGRGGKRTKTRGRVLLVDDTCNHGTAMARAVQVIGGKAKQITRLVVYGPYQVENPHDLVDIWFEELKGPRCLAWNLMKHARLRRMAFDFDGVLCRDPTNHENDDGPRYVEFLRHAEPLFLPRRPIGHIVTGRLEKYRGETEEWLARHGIETSSLVMAPFHDKAERMDAMKFAGGRGGWKAGIARELDIDLFVESCPKQAAIIAREARLPVWCTRSQSLALPS